MIVDIIQCQLNYVSVIFIVLELAHGYNNSLNILKLALTKIVIILKLKS